MTELEQAARGRTHNDETAERAGALAVQGAEPLQYNHFKVPLMENLVSGPYGTHCPSAVAGEGGQVVVASRSYCKVKATNSAIFSSSKAATTMYCWPLAMYVIGNPMVGPPGS